MKSIADRLNEDRTLLLDGAMGTELYRRGIQTRLPSWSASALVESPQMVREIHEDYIRAGSEIITTNTFRTSTRALSKTGWSSRAKELTDLAVALAREARDRVADNPVWIAGSVAPLEDCYEPDLTPDSETAFQEHSEMIGWLVDAGVDLILIETMNTIREADAAACAATGYGVPFFVSWTCGPDGNILNGESLVNGIRKLDLHKPAAFLVNCTPAKHIIPALHQMVGISDVPVGAYANIGKAEATFGWEFTHELDPFRYAREAEKWIKSRATIIGGCCGTTPEHISALKHLTRRTQS